MFSLFTILKKSHSFLTPIQQKYIFKYNQVWFVKVSNVNTMSFRMPLFPEQIVPAVRTHAVLWFTFPQFCSRIIWQQQPQHNRKPEPPEFNFSIHSCNQNTRITTTGIYQAPPIRISLIIKVNNAKCAKIRWKSADGYDNTNNTLRSLKIKLYC